MARKDNVGRKMPASLKSDTKRDFLGPWSDFLLICGNAIKYIRLGNSLKWLQ